MSLIERWSTVSLTNTRAAIVIWSILSVCVLLAAMGLLRRHLVRRTLVACGVAVVFAAMCWVILDKLWKPFPDPTPFTVFLSGGMAIFVLVCAIGHTGRRMLLLATTACAVAAAFGVANLKYQQYPDFSSFDKPPSYVKMNYEEAMHADTPPEAEGMVVGALVSVDLPASKSGFAHRPAVAYLPPAYFTDKTATFPVVVLMAGNPGAPKDWFTYGDAAAPFSAYQAEHNGRAPVVISVDATGTFTDNPLCIDGSTHKVQTYLTEDIPDGISSSFRTDSDHKHWLIGGLSYGGTCAFQVITNHPDSYGGFLDFSGQREPTLGNHQQTIDQFFGRNEEAFKDVNPADLLDRAVDSPDSRYQGISGLFIAGNEDKESKRALSEMNAKAKKAGMNTEYREVEGGHSYQTWRNALKESINFIVEHTGLGAQ